eukprot:3195093-Prymnesium_polylepis.1
MGRAKGVGDGRETGTEGHTGAQGVAPQRRSVGAPQPGSRGDPGRGARARTIRVPASSKHVNTAIGHEKYCSFLRRDS